MVHSIGRVVELVRYPVKSMAGTSEESIDLGWYGIPGDRRFAFRRLGVSTGFPWLSASRFPKMLLYKPHGLDNSTGEPHPTHVKTPEGESLELMSEALQRKINEGLGSDVELMHLKQGIFDDSVPRTGEHRQRRCRQRQARRSGFLPTTGFAAGHRRVWLRHSDRSEPPGTTADS